MEQQSGEGEGNERDGLIQRMVDWIFGYDFFISYSHRDGLGYPRHLKARLEQAGFKVFLDQTEFVPGIELRREARRQLAKTSTIVVLGRPFALASDWVQREVRLALGFRKTPVIIDINGAIDSNDGNSELARLALDKDWLRVNEPVADADGDPSPHAVGELIRGFRHTRQQTKRLRIFATAAFMFALVAGVAVWQAVEAMYQRNVANQQRRLAERNEEQAKEERDRALIAQSRLLADLAQQQARNGEALTGVLLALEALPDENAKICRPYVAAAEVTLDALLRHPHESMWLKHDGGIDNAQLSPRGNRIVTTSPPDKFAILWDATTGAIVANLVGHQDGVSGATFSPDAALVVTWSYDHTARIWDAVTGGFRTLLEGHEGSILGAVFSRDGSRLLTTAVVDDVPRLWDVVTGKVIAVLDHKGSTATFSPDGKKILTTSEEDNTPRIWDGLSGKALASLSGHELRIEVAAFSPDSARIITGSWDETARIWDVAIGTELFLLRGHAGIVEHAEFSPDNRRVVTASARDQTARLWDTETGREIALLKGHKVDWGNELYAWRFVFSPDSQYVVTIADDPEPRVWSTFDGSAVAVLRRTRSEGVCHEHGLRSGRAKGRVRLI